MKAKKLQQELMLVTCGAFVAPMFYLLAVLQLAVRQDFDIRRLPLSYLSIGRLGWIQDFNFFITGVLAVACAIGLKGILRQSKGGRSIYLLVGLFGVGMITAGVFTPDPLPALGGAPTLSGHGALHMVAFMTAFLSLVATCFVMGRRFAREQRAIWKSISIGTGLMVPLFVILSSVNPKWAGLIIAFAGLVLFSWFSAIAFDFRRSANGRTSAAPGLAVARS